MDIKLQRKRIDGLSETLKLAREAGMNITVELKGDGFTLTAQPADSAPEIKLPDELCGDFPAPCNCDDYEVHDLF